MNSSLINLNGRDFVMEILKDAKVMCCKGKSTYNLVLIYSTRCKFCGDMLNVFKTLPGSLNCQFSIMNIDMNKQFLRDSEGTINRIRHVPLVILYINSIPYSIYDGPANAREILRFITEISKTVNATQSFSAKKHINKTKKVYQYYIPKSEEVCYLEIDDAYNA